MSHIPLFRPWSVDISDLSAVAARAQNALKSFRYRLPAPLPKTAPALSGARVARLSNIPKARLYKECGVGAIAEAWQQKDEGDVTRRSRPRSAFPLKQAWDLVRKFRTNQSELIYRPDGGRAVVIASMKVAESVEVSICTLTLAQGLALRGNKVLLIDMDPNADITSALGFGPIANEVLDEVMIPVLNGAQQDLCAAVLPTYWHGL